MDSGTRKGPVLTGGYPPETAKNLKYSPDRLSFEWLRGILALPPSPEKQDGMLQWLTHKYEGWRYEDESRVFLDIKEPDALEPGNFFSYFGPETIDLKEVIIGVKCQTTVAQVEAILERYEYSGVKVLKAALSPSDYVIIEGRDPGPKRRSLPVATTSRAWYHSFTGPDDEPMPPRTLNRILCEGD